MTEFAARQTHRVLVVGQTPPPYGGQAIMIAALLSGRYARVQFYHVPLAFSREFDEVGRMSLRKVWTLFQTVVRIWIARVQYRTPTLYYPPAGPNLVPVLRDIVILSCTRWLFRDTIFHFHASGVSEIEGRLPSFLRLPFRFAYGHPSLSLRTASENPADGAAFGAKRDVVIPCGIPDMANQERTVSPQHGESVIILYVGVLRESKGVRVLLDAIDSLVRDGINVTLRAMGQWSSDEFRRECVEFVRSRSLTDRVEWLGVKTGPAKFRDFAECDIFCFPTYFDAESFGIVLLEAMQFSKPVVATRWRGIPSVVEHGENGLLVPVRDAKALAKALQSLVLDADLRTRLGKRGRARFLERFTLAAFHGAIERELTVLLDDSGAM